MTISNTLAKAGPFSGDGVNASFPFTFKVFVKSDVQVVKTSTAGIESTLVLDSDYSVALNADQNNSPGGTITYPISGTKLAVGESLTLVSAVPDLQPTDITNGGGFYPNIVEDMIDRRAIISHQNAEATSRSLKLPVSAPAGTSTVLPLPSAGSFIGWNSLGNGLQNFAGAASVAVSTFMATVVAAANAAAARAGIGAAAAGANGDITSLSGLTTPLSIGQGGTGGITATLARASLGAAESGANSTITSMTGLTTPLSVAQGGTGSTTGVSGTAIVSQFLNYGI